MEESKVLAEFTATLYPGDFLPPLFLDRDFTASEVPGLMVMQESTHKFVIETITDGPVIASFVRVTPLDEENPVESYWEARDGTVYPLSEVIYWFYLVNFNFREKVE